MTRWVLIPTGITGAIITRSTTPRRTPAATNRPGATAASGTTSDQKQAVTA